ncbi:AAA domain-containing protein [Paenibacillus etheri]|uniref:PLD phosphodiesterase domain-containing protein n=1 Tax=Paenibacillus etheri TaxID=1306852 RepID=A0A0W1B1K5_9BACL|nr:AAA domain-containing protein [Paenibacillus etheri]KTD87470.1 hypothetical protein UQ64_11700 [Paenibacillus etheri]
MNTLDYWRNSLADADRMNPNFDKMKKKAIIIDLDNIMTGVVPNKTTEKLFGDKYKNNQISLIEVLLCPIISYIKKEHSRNKGNHPETLTPLWIPALLNKNGQLLVATKKVPWIPRDYLDPCLSGVYPISTLSAVDQFLTEKPFKFEMWKDYWSHTVQMFTDLTDSDLDGFEHEQYSRTTESYIMLNEQISGATTAVQMLYDHIRENKPTTALLKHFASIDAPPQQIAKTLEESYKSSSRHFGQMGQQFPLSLSQRESIHNWFNIENGELLALNGPPGTGKTTFLQSVISTSWIEAALNQSEPPIMVVSSSNNQPVTNVIESFAKIQEVPHPLAGRWVPQIEGYGSYLAASSKKDKELKTHWQTIKMDSSGKKNGLLASIENLDEVSKAAYEYLEQATRFSGIQFVKVEDVVAFLHQSLVNCVSRLEQIMDSYSQLLQIEGEFNNKYPEGVAVFKKQAEEQIHSYRLELKSTEDLEAECNDYLNKWPFKWFLFIPIVRKIKDERVRKFLESKEIPDIASEDELRTYFHNTQANQRQAISNIEGNCRVAVEDEQQLSLCRQSLDQYRNQMVEDILMYFPDDEAQDKLTGDTLALLDRTLRYEAFKLAVHYWEGRWILETRDMLGDPNFKQTKGINSQQKLWRRYAKLTPCFVTTLFMLPSFFKAWQGSDQYLYEFIDTLIIDEAGQVTPELAGASFALAKKALIVGDILQIEPIWNIPFAIDGGNLLTYGIINNEQDAFEFREKGIMASSGSVMLGARRKSKFSLSNTEGGMWLVEHRRCVPDIINYCNELAYYGRLQPKRAALSTYHLPHMGYAHIPGEANRKSGSLYNEIEADAIVSWIHRNQDLLIKPYAKDESNSKCIDEVVAIITPFYQQKKLLLDKLARTGLKAMKNITVGTVHALQGAERPVVIFSPVYNAQFTSALFFDAGVNMLNVAVSRAQDSFLVFGDMPIFDSAANTPSGLLARYLFASEEQEIRNVEMPLYFKTRLALPVDHIQDLEGHRTILTNSIRTANREVHIVSPFLSSNALDADELKVVCLEAIERGVKIVVYTDEALNKRHGFLLPHFIKAKEMLSAWGVQVVITKRVHSKALWIDKDMLIEGSFNWLSAVRKPNSQWCRYETSLIFRGDKVNEMIEKIKEDLEKRMLVAQK